MDRSEHNDHLDDWTDRFESTESETFVRDGDLGDYWQADTRICAVLKETNKPVVCHDLRKHHTDKLEGDLKRDDSIFRLSVWAAAVRNRCASYDDCREINLARKIGRELAVVNIKKTSGGSSTDTLELHEFASAHRSDLIEQLELLDPEIVFGCGKSIDLILMWLFWLEWREQSVDKDEKLRWAHQENRTYLALAHPSYPPAPRREYERLTQAWPQIQSAL